MGSFKKILFFVVLIASASAHAEKEKKNVEFTKYKRYSSGSFNVDEGKIGVEEGYIAEGVKNLSPVNPGTEFPQGIKVLYCFTRVTGARRPTHIKHIWYLGEKKVAEIKLQIRSPNFRTYSSKRIPKNFVGEGRCEVYDEEGFNLATLRFRVVKK